MNHILFELKGYGFVSDDFEFLQDATLEKFNGMLSVLATEQPSFVYAGCAITITQASAIEMAPGWVVVAGELLPFDGQTITPGTQEEFVKFEKTIEDITTPASLNIDDNGDDYHAYKRVKAILTTGLSGNTDIDSSKYSLDDGTKYWYTYKDILFGKEKHIPLVGNWAFNGQRTPHYRKDFNGMVTVTGKTPNIANSSNAYSNTIGTLPVGFRPSTDIIGVFITENGSYPVRITSSTGDILILASAIPTENGELIFPPYKGI